MKKVVKTTKLKTPRRHGNPILRPDWPRNHTVITQKTNSNLWLGVSTAYVMHLPPWTPDLKKSKSKYLRQQTRSSIIEWPLYLYCIAQTMEQPTKQESQQLLTKFKNKGTANKVSHSQTVLLSPRRALIAAPKTQPGAQCPLQYISVSTAALSTETLVFTSLS